MANPLLYAVSLPERLTRGVAAGAGGLLYETSLVLLPDWTRDMQLYQALIGRMLRITVEWVGGVQGVMPPGPVTADRLAVRKVAGNVVEFSSIFLVGWSPLWMLAAAADLVGGTQIYLQAVTEELKRLNVLRAEQGFTSVDGLLDSLQGTTGALSRVIDIPPLARAELQVTVKEMRESWETLRENSGSLPTGEGLKAIGDQVQQVAEREGTSVWAVSTMIGLGAVHAGIRLGQANIYDYYRSALGDISSTGFPAYVSRVSKPYLAIIARHLNPSQETYTERALKQVRLPALKLTLPRHRPPR
jgi:hypothetical protein